MTDNPIAQLFISHHSSKLSVALQLEETLAKYDVKCWMAPRDVEPGEAFDMAIKRAIDESCGILLLFCSKSDKSPHVKRELILADSSRKAIIPLRLEEIDPDELAYHLANSQWIDWLERRDSTIERVAAKAHQLNDATRKIMTVDELIDRSGNEDATGGSAATSDFEEPNPLERASGAGKVNWSLIVATLALGVAIFAAVLIWRNLAPQPANVAPVQIADKPTPEKPVTEAPPPKAEAEISEPAPPAVKIPKTPEIRPSFNCDNASFRIEFLICGSAELADLDRALASAYKRAMKTAGSRQTRLQIEQRAWRKEVRDVCADSNCAAATIRERIARLKEIAVRGMGPADDRANPVDDFNNSIVIWEG